MTVDEGQKVIEDFRSQGKSDEEIAGAFFLLFRDNKIDINGLEGLVNLLGYRLDDEFKQMSPEDQKKYGYEVIDEQGEGQEPKANDNQEGEAQPQQEEQPSQQEQTPAPNQAEDDEKEEEARAMNMLDGKSTPEKQSDEDKDEEEEARKLLNY